MGYINIWGLDGFSVNVDPNGAFKGIETQHIHEMCGIIPTFFAKAVMNSDDDFDEVIEGMDQEYGFGGFGSFPFEGKVKGNKYISPDKEDRDLDALTVSLYQTEDKEDKFKLYQFEYGIVALEDIPSGKTKIARFD
jgi:hypothetical protein|tara:strand:+ start:2049 stop:2456 length:408 start_codon:yes stop_codon:yes gene_type:complete